MTNSQALTTSRQLRLRIEALQSFLDAAAANQGHITLRSARQTCALALTDAEELSAFMEHLAEQTLNQIGAQP